MELMTLTATNNTVSTDHTVSESTRARMADGVAQNTRRAYGRALAVFTDWCTAHRRTALPCTPQTLAEYVSQMADDDRAPSSIEQAMSAIRTAHRVAGMELPDTTAARLVLRSHRRNRAAAGSRTRKAPPVVIDSLRRMIDICDPDKAAGLRDRLLLVLGFALMGRRSELAALDTADVRLTPQGLVVLIRKSKTDQDAEGAEVFIPHGQHLDTDPVALVRAWLALLETTGKPTDGPLLRSVDRHGNIGGRMPEKSINEAVRRIAVRAAVPAADAYTAHSLRAGGATAAYKGGAPVSAIAAHGRWAEGSPVVLGYIRAVDKWTDNPMRGVGL